MPTYEYACKQCGERFEVFQSFKARPLKKHDACGGPVNKVFHASGVVFKGPGFYATDGRPGATKTASTPSASKGSSSDSTSSDSSKSAGSAEKAASKPSSDSKSD